MKNLEAIRHSLAHLLAAAVLEDFPDAKLGIGPVIENGFYYDFKLSRPLTDEDLKVFEKKMRALIKAKLPFTHKAISTAEAKKYFKEQPFKLELIDEFSGEGKELTLYATGDIFTDLCKGGHVENTKEIDPDAFALTTIAGAYWRGNEKNPQLQRIYGLAFESKKELGIYREMLENAKKRDHKKLGPALDLFTFSDLVGSGLPLWTPKGTLMRNLLDDFVWHLRKEAGYMQVDIPHITKKDLYERSGHWEKFKDELFKITTREGHVFVMKPMNCPHHTQIYARKPWSYRELPQRYANTTKCYRDEQSGELSGLSRVRAFTQDDAHVFCRKSQVKEEMGKVWDIIHTFYRAFGFSLQVRLSLRNPEESQKYLGDPEVWDIAENELRDLIRKKGATAVEAKGEAAFYGPKIDFMAKDSLGREWQIATIQLDMNMPERFDLSCTNEKGEDERIVMIHAAIMGSIERFLSIFIEHCAGDFPAWLSPVQATIVPVGEAHSTYAEEVLHTLTSNGIRAELLSANETLGKRVREAELQKIPYVLVVGDKEIETRTVAIRKRHEKTTNTVTIETYLKDLKKEIAEKSIS